jgi:hypothetical protein
MAMVCGLDLRRRQITFARGLRASSLVQLGRSVECCRQALALLVRGHGPILHHNAHELGSR